MNVFALIKATIVCGLTAYFIYTYPAISQAAVIGLLFLLWASCAHRTIAQFRRR
jgi:hypothetical protein